MFFAFYSPDISLNIGLVKPERCILENKVIGDKVTENKVIGNKAMGKAKYTIFR